jgi:hypothetical protein
MRLLRDAFLYFLIVFAAGWVLGAIRMLIIAPAIGSLAAVAIEAPIMLFISWVVARRAFAAYETRALLEGGMIALALLLGAEYLAAALLRRQSIGEFLASYDTPEGIVSLFAYFGFAVMPLTGGRRAS